MSTRTFIVLSFVFVSRCVYSQPQLDLWREYHAGALTFEKFEDVYLYSDGGYALCGSSGSSGWITKLNGEGNVEWETLLDSSIFLSNIEADNGDIVAGGMIWLESQMFGAVRLNNVGDTLWTRTYCEGSCSAIIELKEGDFMLAGWSGRAGYVARIRPDGELIWGNEYRIGGEDEYHRLHSMRETDRGVVIAGRLQTADRNRLGWAIKVGFGGDELWSRSYQGEGNREFYSIISDPRGGFTIGGSYWQDWEWGGSERKFHLTRITVDGDVITERVFHFLQGRGDQLLGINKLRDGYILVGTAGMQGYTYPFALRTDLNLEPVWDLDFGDLVERRPPGTQPDTPTKFSSTVVDDAGAIIACGGFMSDSAGRGQDGILGRLEPAPLGPQVFYKLPEDSINTILVGDSIQFVVRARNREGMEMNYEWALDDLVIGGNDTTVTIVFQDLGDFPVTCLLSDDDAAVNVSWMILVRNFFIVEYSPDSLNLKLRRGSFHTFSIDSIALLEGAPPNYQWTLTDLNSFEAEETGTEAGATIDFLHSGDFQLEGLAYRGESSDNVIWTIAVRSAILDFTPRSLSLSTFRDSTLQFSLLPFNPESDSLKFSWLLDGTVRETDTLDNFSFTFSQTGQHQVSGILLDGVEGDTVSWTVTVEDPGEVGKSASGQVNKLELLSAYPNPFNSTTTIRFTVPSSLSSSLTLHDPSGRQVRECLSAEVWVGEHTYLLNGEDLPAGIYLIRLNVEGASSVRKIVLIR